MKKTILLSATLSVLSFLPAFPWGQKGHDTTAAIAERHLTRTTKDSICSLLDGKSIVYWANWLDNASHTDEYAHTKTWHYKNVDAGVDFDNAPLLDSGDIVRAISEQTSIARNPMETKEKKALAVKMLVHLLGDIHQPMHMGHASDRGGNSWKIRWFGRDTNLHSVWDSDLPEAAHRWSYTEWADQIDRSSSDEEEALAGGSPREWGKETFEICTRVYDQTPQGTDVSYDYIAEWTPTVEQQLLKGGLRLAGILNYIFDPEYEYASGKNGKGNERK